MNTKDKGEARKALRYCALRVFRINCVIDRIVMNAIATYGAHGPLVSGIVREHFPQSIKDRLRTLVKRIRYYNAKRDGVRLHKVRGAVLNTWYQGYYVDLVEKEIRSASVHVW